MHINVGQFWVFNQGPNPNLCLRIGPSGCTWALILKLNPMGIHRLKLIVELYTRSHNSFS